MSEPVTTWVITANGPQELLMPAGDGATGPAGPPGPQGDTGLTGAAGAAGADGAIGPAGATGPPGAPGPPGADGAQGIQGEIGPEGPPGSEATNAVIVVAHGSDPNVARPVGAAAVYWQGSVAPVNAIDGDLWVEVSEPFTPSDITGLAAWYDASDAGSITSSSGAVSQWNDKSGNTRHLVQATAAEKPTTGTTTINGLNALKFDGGDCLAYAGGTGIDLDAMDMFVVFREDTEVTNAGVVVYHSGTGDDYASQSSFALNTADTSKTLELIRYNGGAGVGTAWIAATGATPLACYRVVLAGPNLGAYKNGVIGSSSPRAGTYTTPTGGIVVGARYLAGAIYPTIRLNGVICEIVAYNRVLTGPETADVEAYLTAKWGL